MNCGEPKPGGVYETCDQDLRHADDHAYLNQRWPRLVPAEPDWKIAELLDAAVPADSWGIEERSFPIMVVETVTKVIWIDAEDEDHALAYWGADWSDIPLEDAHVIESCLDLRRPDKWELDVAFEARRHGAKIGPQIACPDCGRLAFHREWMHDPMRKCHGPIEWRETKAPLPALRYRREFRATPVYGVARQVVAP
ncbi:hypothetical protein ACIQVR_27200 [Streptomyces xanthochromogenes]|uniref:hypothetical protein n=1 Tax=Streptomyces xanthochromogenes TaxID=67384 RepID=UPI0037F92945